MAKRPRDEPEQSKVVVEELCRSVKRLHTAPAEQPAGSDGAENRAASWPTTGGAPHGHYGAESHLPLQPQQQQQQQAFGIEPLRPINHRPLPVPLPDPHTAVGKLHTQQQQYQQQQQHLQQQLLHQEIDWQSYEQANRLLGQLHMERIRRLGQAEGQS